MRPSFVALCARNGGPITSPIAKTCGFVVRSCRSTLMYPLGPTSTPALSAARSSVFGRPLRAQALLPTEAEGGRAGGRAARRDDRVRERDVLGDARAADVQAPGSGKGRLSGEALHAVPLAQLADPVHEPLDDGRLPRL